MLTLPLLLGLLLMGCVTPPPNSLATHDSSKWEKDISILEAQRQTNAPSRGGIVFVGSSSIRLWKSLAEDFPGLPVVNRGFGGSQLADSVHYADRIILSDHPRQVVIYAGGNDLNAGKDPVLVYGDFVALVRKLRAGLPRVRLAYISNAPSPKRWAQVDRIRSLNGLISAYCRRQDIDFINIFPLLLGPDGLPKPEIYAEDQLHFNAKGYQIWADAVRPCLK